MSGDNKVKNVFKNGLGEYKAGFDPEIPSDVIEKSGINEDVIRYIVREITNLR